ncbi:Hypothetical protein FKW44_014900 [Caligus rogercresseyi]|uniref:Uncharacterized protein n=1 Tax=Caligus rogercresseyi TaxID=217165 RepID=A0A7T8K0S4_CALRO|nr:Hypothetical protein FKW44_014900 [Caligus rogercresseyi]
MNHSINSLCRGCGEADEDTLHLARHCPKFELERVIFLDSDEEFGDMSKVHKFMPNSAIGKWLNSAPSLDDVQDGTQWMTLEEIVARAS